MSDVGLKIDLEEKIKSFSGESMTFIDSKGIHRDMNVRDVLQYSISSLPSKQDFRSLKNVYRIVPRISETEKELIITDPEEKEFLSEAIKNSEIITVIPKSFVLAKMNYF